MIGVKSVKVESYIGAISEMEFIQYHLSRAK